MSAPGKWGKEPLDFIHEMQDKKVFISTVDGRAFKGTLVGANPYALVIRQKSGLEMMVNKGNIVYVHAARDD
jgi:hypothetical protein